MASPLEYSESTDALLPEGMVIVTRAEVEDVKGEEG